MIPKVAFFAFVFLATTAHSYAAFSIFNNTIVNKIVNNCSYRAEENIVIKQVTYNQVCDPHVYEYDTANGQQVLQNDGNNYSTGYTNNSSNGYYTSGYTFSVPQQSYSYNQGQTVYYDDVIVYGGNSGGYYGGNSYYNNGSNGVSYYNGLNAVDYYGSGYNPNYLDNAGYYGAVQNYTPSVYGDDFYNQQGQFYDDQYGNYRYGTDSYNDYNYNNNPTGYPENTGCNYDNNGQVYCF